MIELTDTFQGCVQGSGWRGGLPTPTPGAVCRRHVQYPAFTPVSSAVAVGVMVSRYLLGPEFAPAACRQFRLVLHSFVAFCSSRRDVSRYRLCSKGPRVPGLSQTQVLSGVWDQSPDTPKGAG